MCKLFIETYSIYFVNVETTNVDYTVSVEIIFLDVFFLFSMLRAFDMFLYKIFYFY